MTDRKLLFILTDSSGSRVLTSAREGTRTLPMYEDAVPEKVAFADPGPFNRWFAETYGINVVRRYALDQQGTDSAYFILEYLDEVFRLPEGAAWIGADDLDAIHFAHPDQRALLTQFLAHPQQSVTMPWSAPRGYEESLSWMCDQLRQHGRTPSGTPEQIKNAYVSTVMRCPTDAGDVYLKIVPKVFVREIEVLAELTGWGMPELPSLLAIDSERGLMLMEDMGGSDLADCCTTPLLKRTVRQFADFQVASTSRVATERPWPFYDWRMGILAEETTRIVVDARELLAGSRYKLGEPEIDQLRDCLPDWVDLCSRIMETSIPDALDHGDLRLGNIRVIGDRIIFYDWAWSAITHPFMSITSLLNILRDSVAGAEETKRTLRDAYLDAWTTYAPLDELRQVFEWVDRARILYGVAADATWLRCINSALAGSQLSPASADAWALQWRQYYYAKMVRRLFEPAN